MMNTAAATPASSNATPPAMPPATAAIGNDDDGDAPSPATGTNVVDSLIVVVDAVVRRDELLLLRITDAGLVVDTTVVDKLTVLVVDAGATELLVRVMTNDVPVVDVNVDESAVGAVVVSCAVDCDVGDGVDDATNVLAVTVRISVLVVVGIIVVGTMHGVT